MTTRPRSRPSHPSSSPADEDTVENAPSTLAAPEEDIAKALAQLNDVDDISNVVDGVDPPADLDSATDEPDQQGEDAWLAEQADTSGTDDDIWDIRSIDNAVRPYDLDDGPSTIESSPVDTTEDSDVPDNDTDDLAGSADREESDGDALAEPEGQDDSDSDLITSEPSESIYVDPAVERDDDAWANEPAGSEPVGVEPVGVEPEAAEPDSSEDDGDRDGDGDGDSDVAKGGASEFESISEPPMPDTDPWGTDSTEDRDDLEESSGERQENLEIEDGMDVPISTLPVPSVYQELEDLPPTVGDRSSFALADTTHGNANWGDRWEESAQGWIESEDGSTAWRPIVTTSSRLSGWLIETYLGVVVGDCSLSGAASELGSARAAALEQAIDEAMTRGAHAADRFAVRRASGWDRFSRHRDGNGGHTAVCLRGSAQGSA